MYKRRGQFVGTVTGNVPLCREHFKLELRVPGFPATRAGHFVQLLCRENDDLLTGERDLDWHEPQPPAFENVDLLSPAALLRRPFSLAGATTRDGAAAIEIIHRVVGVGTDWLARLSPGGEVGVLGPLGNTFSHPAPGQIAIMVGGGVGIPPMLYLASELVGRKAIAFCGATTHDLLSLTVTADALPPGHDSIEPLFNIGEFAAHGIPAVISTDDGSYGFRGFVTQPLEQYLDQFGIRGRAAVIYTCGPEVMMKRVAQIAMARQIPCQIAVERAMACGMGTCQSCCIRVRKPDPRAVPMPGQDWCYRLACTDGPVFEAQDLLW